MRQGLRELFTGIGTGFIIAPVVFALFIYGGDSPTPEEDRGAEIDRPKPVPPLDIHAEGEAFSLRIADLVAGKD